MKHLTFTHMTTAFFAGCIAYPLLEIAYRGHSHWTMSLTGGLCLAALFSYQFAFEQLPSRRKALLGTLTILALELAVGTVSNLWLGWAIWDYTDLRFHYLGQISLEFALIWYVLCSLFFRIADGISAATKKREPNLSSLSFHMIMLRKPFRRPCK